MIIWGIDPGATTGYGVLVDGELRWCGEWKLGTGSDGERCRRLWLAMEQLAVEAKPDHVAYERGGGTAFNTVRQHGGYHGIIEVFAHQHGATARFYAPSTVKKRFGGHGRSDKGAMEDAFERRFGHWPRSDNAADAAAIAVVYWEELRDA